MKILWRSSRKSYYRGRHLAFLESLKLGERDLVRHVHRRPPDPLLKLHKEVGAPNGRVAGSNRRAFKLENIVEIVPAAENRGSSVRYRSGILLLISFRWTRSVCCFNILVFRFCFGFI